ncbi:glycosyltransferase [Fibrobacter sp. UWB5]|uniref:glycosyltransferase n=1 Tax=Fibrobacter sp. UWB5 TaxID=1964360 RepID=UPI000B5291C9|nr:glycosyltransferase [Fibrobacter sp. UWB5]
MIKVSIAIPVYNVSKYVEKSLRSALDQDFQEKYEIILVDDCGTDDSMMVVDRVIASHARGNIVRIIRHEKNMGLGPARNTAINNANGLYIFFLDSDDWISQDCLSVLYKKAVETKADAVVGSVERVEDETLRQLGQNQYPDTVVCHNGAGVWMVNHKPDMHIEVWNKLFRTEFLRKNRICFVHRIFEDYYFDFRFRASAQTIAFCSEKTLFYNIRQNSILTTLKATKGSDESVKTFCEILRYLQEMLVNEYSSIMDVYDLYFQRVIWVFENFARYQYSEDQWKYIKEHVKGFCSVIPNISALHSSRNKFIYKRIAQNESLDLFYKVNRQYFKLDKWKKRIGMLRQVEPMYVLGRVKNKIEWLLLGGKKKAEQFAYQRGLNQQHCYDFPAESNGWKKLNRSPVYGNELTGTIFDPFVMNYGDSFLMVASERKSGNLISLHSKDGVRWSRPSTILHGVKNSWETVVNRACVINVCGTWHLWYTGQNNGKGCIGHLTSNNLRQFKRPATSKPILSPTLKAEGRSVMNPCVLWDEQKRVFRMWYAAGENYEPDAIFYAESIDGDKWEKFDRPVLTKIESREWELYKVGGCDVKLLADGSYIMYYIGYQNLDVARICFATSKDGLEWCRSENNLCIAPSKDSWDAHACYKPAVVIKENKELMWYNGRKNNCEYIGLAVKEKNEYKV